MDAFETPYEDGVEIDFINCEICNKSIRGETLYKLHVTSPAHLKNEEALVAEGKIPRQQFVPVFEDVLQYLDYLNIDEPVIGLSYLVEVPSDPADIHSIKYNCTLCKVYAYLSEVVQHVIGRKHRQKYLEKNRADLVNWDPNRPPNSGKLMRAKAEIAERQDGQGKPKLLSDKTQRRQFQRSSFQGGPKNGQGSSFTHDIGPMMPKFGSYAQDSGRQMTDNYREERYENPLANRSSLADSEMYTDHYQPDRDGLGDPGVGAYEREDSGDFSHAFGRQDQDRRIYGHSQREQQYPDVFRKPPAQKDVLKEFYTEELRREQLAKSHKWTNDTQSQHEHIRRPRELAPGVNQSSYPTSVDTNKSQEIYKLITDYRHEALVERPQEALSKPGQSRASPSRPGDFSRKISNIPDPFMRFLKGEPSHEGPQGRKRKSRFSDATAEELKTAHEMLADEFAPPNPKFPTLRPQIGEFKTPQTDRLIGLKPSETYQKKPLSEGTESTADVLEMLNNIEIENEEEANFLKERLCSVLREFKARKAERAAQTGSGRPVKDYTRPITQQHTQERYGRTRRENLDIRREEEPYSEPSQVPYSEQMVDEDFHERTHPGLQEARYSNRKPYKDVNRWPDNNHPELAPSYDMPAPFPETFQEPLRPRDYESADNFSDYPSSTSHVSMERGPRMTIPPQYSRNLDKITSTLLEFVKRK